MQQEVLEYIVKNLVANKDAVEIESVKQGRTRVFNVWVDKKDLGNVIGHGGAIANSIRTIVKSMSEDKDRLVIKFDAK